uniref:Gamma-glutamylaminecyclotransferase n=1 Tax=Rhinolophus ferrumequinum TaxID=59479 RepID=A0A671FUU6_RHIFE
MASGFWPERGSWNHSETNAADGSSLALMAYVFVYRAVKRGQRKHKVLLEDTNGCATFQGRGHTVEPYPSLIAGEYNIGRSILWTSGWMLRFLGKFEGCSDTYQLTLLRIVVLAWEGAHRYLVYTTATDPPAWVHLPYHHNHGSQGKHGLCYNPRENRLKSVRNAHQPEDR